MAGRLQPSPGTTTTASIARMSDASVLADVDERPVALDGDVVVDAGILRADLAG